MNFYPVIYTRTNDFDFHNRAMPPIIPNDAALLAREAINEDRFPRMTEPRRVYYRSGKFLFWGMGLHNKWFVPDEIADTWDRKNFGLNLRGFWGGFIDSSNITPETVRLVVSSLLERPNTPCRLSDSLLALSRSQRRADASNEDLRFPPIEFVGSSNFCFPARLFQHFVQKDWHNSKRPVKMGERRLYGQPMISQIPYDLRLFVPDFSPLPEAVRPYNMPASPKPQHVRLLHFNDKTQEENFWAALVLPGGETCAISGISRMEHVVKIAQSVSAQSVSLLRFVLMSDPIADQEMLIPSLDAPDETVSQNSPEKSGGCAFGRYVRRHVRRIGWAIGGKPSKDEKRKESISDNATSNSPDDAFAKHKKTSNVQNSSRQGKASKDKRDTLDLEG